MTQRLLGQEPREAILADLKARTAQAARPPGLAVMLVGDDQASRIYVKRKEQACSEVGFHHLTRRFDSRSSEEEVLACIQDLNRDSSIDGILIQLPLPAHFQTQRILHAVDPRKDVDGFHPVSLGLLAAGHPRFVPCTPRGILHLLQHYAIPCAGKHVVIVGRSLIVGRPLALLLSLKRPEANATVTLCHSGTRDLPAVTRQGDIVVAAVGVPGALDRRHIARGAVVIDVGINRIADDASKSGTRLVGDVSVDALQDWAAAYTPVPGGVGPMTIAMLLQNTWDAMMGAKEAV
jgi:methylenetetrahydrofolate dehydrogenase (NADP+)/methenyltetrahydrofolate cyclohydrolase